eukprot:TRINITY_DN202_c0_g1_i2.p2 TRINITY_DN202_c0_g1~~TRINITY_DN202_c0_g1_i2.p2  ORF type:complete len:248 (+),score=77.64 TRINITY_DN202_c0_g1_i2:100-843(+)
MAAAAAAGASPMVAAVLGASGNVGGALVRDLVGSERWSKVHLFGRRELSDWAGHPKIVQHVVDMAQIQQESERPLRDAQVAACFVTMGVGAPSKLPKGEEGKQELMRIDCDVPAAFGAAAKAAGVRHFSLLGAVGADESQSYSRVTGTGAGGGWYNHVKGVAERRVRELQFPTCGLFRPATLIGNTNTPGFFNWLAPKLDWAVPGKWHSIHIERLARCMARQAESALDKGEPAVYVAEGKTLLELAE